MKVWNMFDDNDCTYHELPNVTDVEELLSNDSRLHGEITTVEVTGYGEIAIHHTSGSVVRYCR